MQRNKKSTEEVTETKITEVSTIVMVYVYKKSRQDYIRLCHGRGGTAAVIRLNRIKGVRTVDEQRWL